MQKLEDSKDYYMFYRAIGSPKFIAAPMVD